MFPLYQGLRVRATEKCERTHAHYFKAFSWDGRRLALACSRCVRQPSSRTYVALFTARHLCPHRRRYFSGPWIPPGVFPLAPVEHTWELSKETGAKIHHRGFTLVPDFASTAFMIQGTSLNAMLADCGGLWKAFTLTDMVKAYVILSRIKSATGLLLLRAFAVQLVRQGQAPRPQCLM